ncbi:hypothetical protein [Planotetraspora sp. GP83]|uniref:hypothetical protein n=1 Tax=Planotetraspora sp. GP83 TaxID=3156264 RepID=UPI0035150799
MTKRKRRSSEERWTSPTLAEWGLTGGQQRLLVGVGSVAAVLAAALFLTFLVNAIAGGESAPTEAPPDTLGKARPDLYQAWPSLKEFAPIADRKADGAPLTAQEVFGARTLTVGKVSLKRIGGRLDPSCANAVWGAELAGLLARAGCTQALRGLYSTADGAYVAQYTMLNLADVQGANGLVESLKTLHTGGWVLPLDPAKAGFGGYSESSGQAMGHYAGLVWVARADGAEPGEKDDFVMLGLAAREAEKAIYRRVVAVAGLPAVPAQPGADTAQPSEPAPSEPAISP